MHACLLKAKKILEVGVQGSKLSIYTYPTYHSLHNNRKQGRIQDFYNRVSNCGVGRYFHRGGETISDTQLNPGNLNSVCSAQPTFMRAHANIQFHIQNKMHPYLFYLFLTNFILLFMQLILYCMPITF